MIKKYAVIENNTVINIVLADPVSSNVSGWLEVTNDIPGLAIGSKYENGTFTRTLLPQIERTVEEKWDAIRNRRNQLLIESDVYVLPDLWASYTPEQQRDWSQYRQTLRDIPQNYSNPDGVIWPVPPSI